ncbi:MAG: glycoside hydrolase family 3 protein [Paucibacter sp.]|nr:glycoside hydrolase family 3 protein [Roseateles sp.]
MKRMCGWTLALLWGAATAAPTGQDPDARAADLVSKMTMEEKIRTVFGYFGTDTQSVARPAQSIPYSAGFVHGVPRLGLPDQHQTDAGTGVATQRSPNPRERTALPSGLAVAATWNPRLAYEGGAMIGREARQSGYNVLLAGGVNLLREPRNGRNFEYAGEDPWLAGVMVGEAVRGIQSNHIVSTIKHFAMNDQETGRFGIDARIGNTAARMSDLLAFQLAIERGEPGAIMCAYNRVNGAYACENDYLLNQVLKRDWGYPGFVMSDWGATHSTVEAAAAGLDQESGWPFDKSPYFNGALREAVENGHLPQARLDDMVRRIVRSFAAQGVLDNPVPPAGEISDVPANEKASQAAAEEAIVLLKNEGHLLPLALSADRIAIIGGHADKGVLSGGGSSQVYPRGGLAVPNEGPAAFPGPMVYFPSSPLDELRKLGGASLRYDDGRDVTSAARLAAQSDVAIVFATQWTAESQDVPTLSLPGRQDELIAAVAAANPRTVVVLETGGPVSMPWLAKVPAVLEAWYPGTQGGAAIARVLSGAVNPSGHLPATFPSTESQLPRPVLDVAEQEDRRSTVNYEIEGAAVGYKWFQLKGLQPLFAFGHGLSYTQFEYDKPQVQWQGDRLFVRLTVRNTGQRAGAAVAQLYASPNAGGWEAPQRLVAWSKLMLKPGEQGSTVVEVDPRLLAVFEEKGWQILSGEYTLAVGGASDAPVASTSVQLGARMLSPQGH